MKKIPVRQRQFVIDFVVPNATLKTHLRGIWHYRDKYVLDGISHNCVKIDAVRTIMLRRLPVVISSLEFEFDVVKRYACGLF